MEMLLHACCAPCCTESYSHFSSIGFKPVVFYCNPNIQPYHEYRKRLDNMMLLRDIQCFDLLVEDYLPMVHIDAALIAPDDRCSLCYKIRLRATAKQARAHGIHRFSTTLLISPYQKHDEIVKIANRVSEDEDVEFVYEDLRKRYQESVRLSREYNLYRQKYCGCFFSLSLR
jgi:hypothetical protein